MLLAVLFLLSALAFCATWYWLAVRYNRRRSLQVLRWIESALSGQGQITGIRWLAHSRFKVPLRLRCGVFHRAWMLVDLKPCEMPLRWLLNKTTGRKDVLTFQADLDLAPSFSLQVHNFHWLARSGKSSPNSRASWSFEQAGPFVISTRADWQKEISSAMASLAKGENREFLDINFQRSSPHFSVSLPLAIIAPDSPTRTCMFETMRELAGSSSASLS
jgi:hypothetical protein